jgi:hypothetical protein
MIRTPVFAIAALFAWNSAVFAQEPAPDAQAASPPTAPAASAAAVDAAATAPAPVSVGLPVRDANGAIIGEVKELKIDERGRELASIKMAGAAFAIEVRRLAVRNGAVVVGATADDLRWLLSLPQT